MQPWQTSELLKLCGRQTDVKPGLTTKGPREAGEPCEERAMVFASDGIW